MSVQTSLPFSPGQAVVWLSHAARYETLARVLRCTPKRIRIRAIIEHANMDPYEATVMPERLREPTPEERERIEALLPWP
ncbi:MAG TPA: hypothetical protein VFT74_06815 [Isosphaeraceae bacterium]|nr:hypothetical protein [Isosphaeraceae bacterium]